MKALVHEKYGPPDLLQFKEVAKPTPKEGWTNRIDGYVLA